MLFPLLLTTADIMLFWSGYRIHERLLKVSVRRRRRREPIKDGKKEKEEAVRGHNLAQRFYFS